MTLRSAITAIAAAVLTAATLISPPAASAAASATSAATVKVSADTAINAGFASPPVGFNPLKASAAQLIRYGLPTRPSDPAGLAQWTKQVSNAKTRIPVTLTPRTAPPTTATPSRLTPMLDGHGHGTSSNWAGNYNTGRTYNSVGAEWNIPAVPTTNGKYSSTWVGLGQGNSLADPLIQAGNDQDGKGSSSSYGSWFEIFGGTVNQEQYTGFPASAGQHMEVDISFSGRTADFFIENVSTGKYQSFPLTLDSRFTKCTCSTAEYIEEDQGPNPGTAHNLASFGSVTMTGCYNYDSANAFHHLGDTNITHSYYNMVDNAGTVAYPGAIASNHADFTIYRTTVA